LFFICLYLTNDYLTNKQRMNKFGDLIRSKREEQGLQALQITEEELKLIKK